MSLKSLPIPPIPGSKSEEWSDFRMKSDQAARRVINGTDVPGKTASHLVFFFSRM
ncbi:hypothetical protein KSC_107190 [Ktedonobacter sp. SOSP1-52]|uniref:hypothetical protein n=1 Tax=Ktedonobacter sp. SOSP1-52 TaxID=2778366 RepID=UPI0019162C3A|nr:hypothetical protein [Ktedonobacter sp. SOSP1-52]GHO71827.1 hypothetical protein KSC_107190 [Ktedonobacter sp. SOSP1-52]